MSGKQKLAELDFSFLEFTSTPGALRCHNGGTLKQPRPKQGIYFQCPKCKYEGKKDHGHTYLFNEAQVPENAQPTGRWTLTNAKAAELGVLEKVYTRTQPGELKREPGQECTFQGFIKNGEVSWS